MSRRIVLSFRLAIAHALALVWSAALGSVALAGQYVIGFVSDNLKRDGKFRKLKIEVKDKGRGLKIQHRVGYVPPTPK